MAFDVATTEGSPVYDLEIPKGRDKDRWPGYVDELLGYLRSSKLGHEFHWREGLLFLTDEQWIRWMSTTQTFRRHNLQDWVPTPVTNFIQKIFDRLLDIMTSGDMMGQARPASDRQDDIDRGKAASRILRSLFKDLDTADTYEEAAGWMIVTGTAILNAGWDPRAGVNIQLPVRRKIEDVANEIVALDPMTRQTYPRDFIGQPSPDNPQQNVALESFEQPMLNERGEQIFDVRLEHERDENGNKRFTTHKEGQVYEGATNPFGFFPQPRSTWKEVDYAIEASAVTPDEIIAEFGTKWRDKIIPEDINVLGWGSFLSSQHGSVLMRTTGEGKEYSLLKRFRHVPSDKFRDGQYTIVVGDNLLHEGPIDTLRTKDGKLPWEMCQYRKIPGELWGHGPFRSAVPQQKRINAIDSSIIHNRKVMIQPKWLIPNNAGVRTIEGKAGAEIRWDPTQVPRGIKPEPIVGVGLPPTTMMEADMTERRLEDLIGTLEVLSGKQPSGVKTLGQHQLLMEQAARRFSPMLKRWRRCSGRHEHHKLRIAREKWSDEREIRVIGEDQIVQVFHYRGADIGDTTDVFIEMTSEILVSHALERQEVKEQYSMGLLGDPRNPETRMKVLQKLGTSGFKNEFTIDAERARRNMHKIRNERNFDVQPFPFDIYPVHFKVITDFIKSADYESEPKEVQDALFQLAMAYQQAMQQEAERAQIAAERTKGSGPQAEGEVVASGAFGGGAQPDTTV